MCALAVCGIPRKSYVFLPSEGRKNVINLRKFMYTILTSNVLRAIPNQKPG
jgi:hypothetical protein